MPRRKASPQQASQWLLSFVERDWPGRCSLERFLSWRSAQSAERGNLAELSEARRNARRELRHPADCAIHPRPDRWPTGWNRGSDRTTFTLTSSDGAVTTEEVVNDSEQDRIFREAFEQWLRRLG